MLVDCAASAWQDTLRLEGAHLRFSWKSFLFPIAFCFSKSKRPRFEHALLTDNDC